MAEKWVRVGTDVVVGGVGGAVSKLVENWDTGREAVAPLGFFARGGTYMDYGLPILTIIGSLLGIIKGDWETRLLTMGGTLAGRRLTGQVTKKTAGWTAASGQAGVRSITSPGVLAAPIGSRAWYPQAIRAG